MTNIIFIAPPAAGKGTISDMLVKKYNYKHISTGELLRNIAKRDDELGKVVSSLLEKGLFASDELVLEIIKKELTNNSTNFILDGYPRNLEQAESLNALFTNLNIDDYVAIYLDINLAEALNRAMGRLVCVSCQATYHNVFKQPIIDGICDTCGAKLIKRVDDTEDSFKRRYNKFINSTKPITDYYANMGKLVKVDVNNSTKEAFIEIAELVKARHK